MYDITCKFSRKVVIVAKCQAGFQGKIRKYLKMSSAEISIQHAEHQTEVFSVPKEKPKKKKH